MDRKMYLMDYIKKEIMRNDKAKISETDDLLSEGILDSLGILQLVAYINDNFGIDVPDRDVVYENFHSVQALDTYLQQFS